jgi:hypothetical protein
LELKAKPRRSGELHRGEVFTHVLDRECLFRLAQLKSHVKAADRRVIFASEVMRPAAIQTALAKNASAPRNDLPALRENANAPTT